MNNLARIVELQNALRERDTYAPNPCGDAAGGFQSGNKCQRKGHSTATPAHPRTRADRPATLEKTAVSRSPQAGPTRSRAVRPSVTQAPGGPSLPSPRIVAALVRKSQPEPPQSDEDVPRFVEQVKASPLFAELQNRLEDYERESPGAIDSWSANRYSKDGQYTPERSQIHDAIAAKALNVHAIARPGERPKALVLAGLPGSGKTSVGSHQAKRHGVEFTAINSDDVKAALPEYQGWNAAALHKESTDVLYDKIMPEAMKARHNILLDTTATNYESVKQSLEDLHRSGYDVHLVHVGLPWHKTMARAWTRFAQNAFSYRSKTEEPGRYVSMEYVEWTDHRAEKNFHELKNHPAVKSWVAIDNDVPYGSPPKVLAEGGPHVHPRSSGAIAKHR